MFHNNQSHTCALYVILKSTSSLAVRHVSFFSVSLIRIVSGDITAVREGVTNDAKDVETGTADDEEIIGLDVGTAEVKDGVADADAILDCARLLVGITMVDKEAEADGEEDTLFGTETVDDGPAENDVDWVTAVVAIREATEDVLAATEDVSTAVEDALAATEDVLAATEDVLAATEDVLAATEVAVGPTATVVEDVANCANETEKKIFARYYQ